MNEAKPLSISAVSKDDVVPTGHERTSIEHVIIKKEVKLEPDYIECNPDIDTEITHMYDHMDNCGNSTYSSAVQFNEGNSGICQNIQITEVKVEFEPYEETSANEISNDLKDSHKSDRDTKTRVTDNVYHTETTNIKLNHKTKKRKPYTKNKLKQGTNRYSCNECRYKCVKETTLIRHIAVHSKGGHSCPTCDYKSKRKDHLKKHMQTHTGEKSYSCRKCDFKCLRKCHLNDHLKIHISDQPFTCNVCDYQFNLKSKLKTHMTTHTSEKILSCGICGHKCTRKDMLTRHMRKHTNDKPYSCEHCDYKSKRKDTLTKHIRTHTGEKPYTCDICDNTFSQRITLNYHMRTHTGEKPYTCDVCEYKCKQKSTLKHHIVKKHNGALTL